MVVGADRTAGLGDDAAVHPHEPGENQPARAFTRAASPRATSSVSRREESFFRTVNPEL
jgi:hypothetical protein